jgi:hypothetical protein
MQMFNRKFKLIGTAVGLVAVLMMGLALPGVTQGYPGDGCPAGPVPCINRSAVVSQQTNPLPSRSQIVNGLNQAFATLTATAGVVWNFDASVLLSTHKFTGAFVPLSKEDFERSEETLADMLRGKPGFAPLGGLYVGGAVKLQVAGEDPISLHAGSSYRLVAVTADRAEVVDSEGNVKGSLPIKVMQVANTTPTKLSPEARTNQNGFEIEVGPNCIEVCIIVIIIIIVSD